MNDHPRKASDQLITAADVRIAMKLMSGKAWQVEMREMQRIEPCLAAYLNTAIDTMGMNLDGAGYPKNVISETNQFVLHAMVVVHTVTREAHRRLLNDFLPNDDGLVRRIDGEGKPT